MTIVMILSLQKEEDMAMKGKKILKICAAIVFAAFLVGLIVFLFSGDNYIVLQQMFRDDLTREELQDLLSSLGWKGYLTFGTLSMLQVVLTFLPAEPAQVMAGLSFGFWKGICVCAVGVFVGNSIIYLLYKIYGDRLENYFVKNAEFDFEAARKSPVVALVVFILYFLPAIPYGLICFFTASMGKKYWQYILLTVLGSIPSICIGVGLGHIAMASSWIISIVVFIALIALLVVLYQKKSQLFAKVNVFMKRKAQPYTSKTVVKKYNPFIYRISAFATGIYFGLKLRIRYKKKVKKIEQPSIVLCNHGSFVDFLFAGQLIKRVNPHFITARLYFYHRKFAWVLRNVGCFPKSMFTSDLENAKNCMRVLSDGGVLAMMPEARLSTAGKFEDVQEKTYRFIQRVRVPVYIIHLKGDYFAKPKWGDKFRMGAHVEGELYQLFTAEEVAAMPFEDLKKRLDEALYYDEFEWLSQHPNYHYKHKTIAEGLENILCRCPQCRGDFTLRTQGRTITCEKCGFTRDVDTRYAFTEPVPFENFSKWYDWQIVEMEKEITENPDYALVSNVTLKHSSKDGKKMLREAGEGVCRLDKTGLTYEGTEDGENVVKHFALADIYRLLFGAGENFEIYEGNEIWYFVPEDTRSCVAWYIASGLLKKIYDKE